VENTTERDVTPRKQTNKLQGVQLSASYNGVEYFKMLKNESKIHYLSHNPP